jgi:unsaturated rhamnogalacturonyl hydrolase
LQGKTGKLYHYLWSDTANSGFSDWGKIFEKKGASIDTLQRIPSAGNLFYADIYIIVDPDTKAESRAPHYLEQSGIAAVVRWVKQGGVLVLMANDSGNCEFEHMNELAGHFGLHFNEVSVNHVEGTNWKTGAITRLPASSIFSGVKKIYLKDVSTLNLKAPAKPILTKAGNVYMAISHVGNGYVFAITDPWIYNEYIGHRYLPRSFGNDKAAENLTDYLMGLSKKARQ